MAKLLIVDDEAKIRTVIKEYAQAAGYETDEASNGVEAVNQCLRKKFDLVIMDVMMPKMDGFTASREIRKDSDVPIIILSARGEEYDKLCGFDLGIDDYVVKPFSPKELMARINAVLTRGRGAAPDRESEKKIIESGDIVLDKEAHTLTVAGEKTPLTLKEFELLGYLMLNRGIALSRDRLLQDVWGYDFFGDDRTIDTHIKNLRSRLGKHRDRITTVRGVGYKFE